LKSEFSDRLIESSSSEEIEVKQKTLQRTTEENKKQATDQAQGTQMVFDNEAYNNYIQDMDWEGDIPDDK
jgi:hypothetical protein